MKCFATMDINQHMDIIRHIEDDEYDEVKKMLKNVEKMELVYAAKLPLVENYNDIIELWKTFSIVRL